MTEELKQKAIDFIDRIGKESGGNWLDKYYLTDLLVMFATENGIQWHDLRKSPTDYPEPEKLVRVHCYNGDEYICETYLYEPSEDEIGYGKMIIQFAELNGDWVDDNCIQAWCEIEPFEEEELQT